MSTEEMLIYDIRRKYDRVHGVELDGETGHYYPVEEEGMLKAAEE